VFLRVQTVTSRGHTYRYAVLVQSYRAKNGKPTNRVVANLGQLSDREIENYRTTLEASRTGARVVILPRAGEDADWGIRVRANLQYLDVAVGLAMWDYWKLSELFNRLLPRGAEAVNPSAVIASLTLQRCLAPGSKFYAQRWFPRTALPELLPMDPVHFNNTRLHRVLKELDRVDGALQEELPARYQQRGVFATLFLDVTDTWFEGRGCDLAQRDRTKEGFRNRYKVGIVLACDQRGYPLRWKVVGGKLRDPQCLSQMVDTLCQLPWVGDAPVVCDRGMGRASLVAKLLNSGLRFLTATTRSEYESYTDAIPHQPLADFHPEGSALTKNDDMVEAGRRVEAAGLQRVEDRLYVLDLGVRERTLVFELPARTEAPGTWDPEELAGGAAIVARARRYRAMLDAKEVATQAELSRREGLTRARLTQIMNTLRLDEVLQEQVMAGDFGHVPEHFLRAVVRLRSGEAQRRLLVEHAQTARAAVGSDTGPRRMLTGKCTASLRLVVYFNPEMFVDQRVMDAHRREVIAEFVETLNRRLRNWKGGVRRQESIAAEVMGRLAQDNLMDAYRLRLETERHGDREVPQVYLDFDPEEWARRRRYDGFVLLVGHPDLPHSAEDLVRLYREKDKVEKDFGTIKSVVKLRPVYHHTDPKVRAHVTICMLALLLERTLEHRLARSPQPMTAPACFEELRTCHLNVLSTDPDAPPTYTVTDATQEQLAILRSLRLLALVDDKEVAATIQPTRSF